MKRGLITWDKNEIPPHVFEARVEKVREELAARELPAMVVYSDLWRSNQARFLSNFMPYFNRALLILPLEGKPVLLCGLSPRVYGWIRSVTTIEDVRPAGNFAKPLVQLAGEQGWKRIGVLDAEQLPYDMAKSLRDASLEIVSMHLNQLDESEIAMRRNAAGLARSVLEEEIKRATADELDYELVGRLERRFRRAGVEDLIVLVTGENGPPAPASGRALGESYSVSIALEYRGHWVRVTRPNNPLLVQGPGWSRATDASSPLTTPSRLSAEPPLLYQEGMGGSYPYECIDTDAIFALHVQFGPHLYYGDTYLRTPSGPELL